MYLRKFDVLLFKPLVSIEIHIEITNVFFYIEKGWSKKKKY